MKKPALRSTFDRAEIQRHTENIDAITGRSGERCDLAGLENMSISNPPTQDEIEFIRRQLVTLIRRLEE